jgi:hypothetical protein
MVVYNNYFIICLVRVQSYSYVGQKREFQGFETVVLRKTFVCEKNEKNNPRRIKRGEFFLENWGSHGGEDIDVGMLGCNAL